MSDLIEQLETREVHRFASGAEWMRSLALDLHRRRVYRAVVTYVIVAWIVLQIADVTFPLFGISTVALKVLACLAVLGLPLTVIVAWIYQLTPNGLVVDRGPRASSRGARQDCTIALLAIGCAAVLLFLLVAGEGGGAAPSVAIAATEVAEPGVPALSIAARIEDELYRQLHSDELQPVATFPRSETVAFVLWVHLTSSRERVHVRFILLETDGGGSPPFVYAFDLPRGSAHEVERRVAERITREVRPRLGGGSGGVRMDGFAW
jgi:hypothetical protein